MKTFEIIPVAAKCLDLSVPYQYKTRARTCNAPLDRPSENSPWKKTPPVAVSDGITHIFS
jgi:hypothetical protein